jgi:putative transcriptional regulator
MGERGLTVAEVVRQTGLTHHTVRGLYRGRVTRIELRTLDILCALLKVEPGDLLEYTPTPPAVPDPR